MTAPASTLVAPDDLQLRLLAAVWPQLDARTREDLVAIAQSRAAPISTQRRNAEIMDAARRVRDRAAVLGQSIRLARAKGGQS